MTCMDVGFSVWTVRRDVCLERLGLLGEQLGEAQGGMGTKALWDLTHLRRSHLSGYGESTRGMSSCRPLAYSTLADLVHHVRQHLPLSDLSLAVQLFAKNIDDESLPSSIQTMSCKLLLNLVDCIRSKSEQESGNGRDVLMRMLEVCPPGCHGHVEAR